MPIDLEGETLGTASSAEGGESSACLPTLTILCHPDPNRVGERLVLRAVTLGHDVLLSRGEPLFNHPADEAEESFLRGKPLGERFLSRKPIRLRPAIPDDGRDNGGIVLDRRGTPTRVEIDGEDVVEERVLSPRELAAGVVLKLARTIVLLLHRSTRPPGEEATPSSCGLIGESDTIVRLRQEIERLAPLDMPVLLRGETGTGKELVARALHDHSGRNSGPFVAVNMGVLGPSLAAAALFGAERGAYTGADRKRAGYFQSAHGGTLFLDEIGEAPPEVQVMLLRTLETQEIQPVGSVDFIKVDVRVIAATDARLEEAMSTGRFKMPLYHRLAGYTLNLPPLRERREDLGRLLYSFLEEELAKLGRPPLGDGDPEHPWPPAKLIVKLASYGWPGNVRELRNTARKLAIAGPAQPTPDLEMLLPPVSPEPSAPATAPPAPEPSKPDRRTLRKLSDIDEAEILKALRDNRWHLQATADALNISRSGLYRLLEDCPSVRTANQIPLEDIERAVQEAAGDLDVAAFELEVSVLGLKRRMKALGLDLS